MNDLSYEVQESFTLNLHSGDMNVRLPNINRTRIMIEDDDSKIFKKFLRTEYKNINS